MTKKNSILPQFVHSWYVRTNPGRFGPESFRPGSFRPIFRVGRFGLGRWVVLAHFRGEWFWPWVVSAKVYRNYYGYRDRQADFRFGDCILSRF